MILPPKSTIGNPYFEESLSQCLPFFENGEFVFSCLDRPLDPPDPELRYKGILYALVGNLENNDLAGLRNSLETSRRHREKCPNIPWSDLDQAVSGTLSQSDRETLVKKINKGHPGRAFSIIDTESIFVPADWTLEGRVGSGDSKEIWWSGLIEQSRQVNGHHACLKPKNSNYLEAPSGIPHLY